MTPYAPAAHAGAGIPGRSGRFAYVKIMQFQALAPTPIAWAPVHFRRDSKKSVLNDRTNGPLRLPGVDRDQRDKGRHCERQLAHQQRHWYSRRSACLSRVVAGDARPGTYALPSPKRSTRRSARTPGTPQPQLQPAGASHCVDATDHVATSLDKKLRTEEFLELFLLQ
jgi:hypothetical protein